MDAKRLAAEKAVEYVTDGMVIGLGTGSTAYWAIQRLGQRVREGLQIKAIATSLKTEELARASGIHLVSFADINEIDITIDGADEVDEKRNLIKGGGGALLREKIVAFHSKVFLVVVDESKPVQQLGKFPLPVEIVPFGAEATLQKIKDIGVEPSLRLLNDKPFVTDNGNLVADCKFYPITDPMLLNQQLHMIPGVVETGLFPSEMVTSVIIGSESGYVKVLG